MSSSLSVKSVSRLAFAAVMLNSVGVLFAAGALAQAPPPIAIENPAISVVVSRDQGGHWTPSALFDAQLLPLPIPTQSLEALTEGVAVQQNAAVAQVTENGASPIKENEVASDTSDKLFADAKPSIAGPAVTEASGQAGAFFTSSRLVPEEARLSYPYRVHGKIFFEQPGVGNFICSGAVIKPRLILTAGHCVHKGSGGAGGFYTKFLFVPAYHRGESPYQAWNWAWVTTTGSWSTSNGAVPNRADLAIIEVEDRKFDSTIQTIGEVVGWTGFRTNALMPNHTKKIGYPGNHDNGEVMHHVDSQSFEAAASETVLYGSDMRGGSSGGLWIENFGVPAQGQQGALNSEPNRAVGVTSYGFVDTNPKVQGSSILNDEFLSILNLACAHRPGNC